MSSTGFVLATPVSSVARLHKDPPPVLRRRQPGGPADTAAAALGGDRDPAASGLRAAVELLLDHFVEKSAKMNATFFKRVLFLRGDVM